MSDSRLIDTGSSGSGWSYFGLYILCPQKWAKKYRPHGGGVFGVPATIPEYPLSDSPELNTETTYIIKPEDPTTTALPLRKGSVLHGGLAHHYVNRIPSEKDKYYPHEVAVDMLCRKYAFEGKALVELKGIIDAYIEHYRYETIEPLYVEKLFSMQINGHLYTMRVDLIWLDEGKVYFADHKSGFHIDASTITKYTLSGQFVAADLIGRKFCATNGFAFGGVVANLLPSTVASKAQFQRKKLPPTPGMSADRFKRSITRAAEEIAYHDEQKTPVLEYPRAMHENICVTAYGKCENFEGCQWDL